MQCINYEPDVIVLSEIWNSNLALYTKLLKNYEFFFSSSSRRAGGVGIYVHNKFKPKV
jgi:exonuclease III